MDYESPSPQQNAAGKRGKPSKACVPCRARKIKCDAAVTGLPCSSCVSRQCVPNCVLSARKPRRRSVKTLHLIQVFLRLIQYHIRTIRTVAADKEPGSPRRDELVCEVILPHVPRPPSCAASKYATKGLTPPDRLQTTQQTAPELHVRRHWTR